MVVNIAEILLPWLQVSGMDAQMMAMSILRVMNSVTSGSATAKVVIHTRRNAYCLFVRT